MIVCNRPLHLLLGSLRQIIRDLSTYDYQPGLEVVNPADGNGLVPAEVLVRAASKGRQVNGRVKG